MQAELNLWPYQEPELLFMSNKSVDLTINYRSQQTNDLSTGIWWQVYGLAWLRAYGHMDMLQEI